MNYRIYWKNGWSLAVKTFQKALLERSTRQPLKLVCMVVVLWPAAARAQSGAGSGSLGGTFVLPEVTVVAPTPLQGDGIDRDKVPATVQTLRAQDFERTNSFSTTDTLGQRIPGTTITDVQGNAFFQDLRYRGFAASPLQGTPPRTGHLPEWYPPQ
jgi:iron complex outermembrane recepter protein